MIYGSPSPSDPVDQGDLIEGCPALHVREFRFEQTEPFEIDWESRSGDCRPSRQSPSRANFRYCSTSRIERPPGVEQFNHFGFRRNSVKAPSLLMRASS